jgi:hypothetical protein
MKARTLILWVLSVYIAIVFVQSLFFKFTGAYESIYIFSTLRAWSGIALCEPAGRWIIGSCELIASILLLTPRVRIFGACLAIGIMTGAIFFHLFTPLGVVILGDGGELFTLACGVWISGWIILWLSADDVKTWLSSIGADFETALAADHRYDTAKSTKITALRQCVCMKRHYSSRIAK